MSQNYKKGPCIGRGSFGQVYKGMEVSTGNVVALKLQDLEQAADEIEIISREVQVMSEISSPYIVRYFSSFIEGHTLWLVMEYMAGGSLKDILDVVGPFPEDAVAAVLKPLCSGLAYIHKENKLHRDIKAANILLTASAEVKLADFGVAKQMTNTLRARNTYVGTPFWMAPEVIARSQYDQTCDIWSVGITAIELLTGSPPYSNRHVYAALDLITRNDPPRLEASFSSNARDFVAKCLARLPRSRASAADLVDHPFLNRANPRALKDLLRSKNAALSKRSSDSVGAIGAAESADEIPLTDPSSTMAWEFDSGTDSNAGTVRVTQDEDLHGTIGSADTIYPVGSLSSAGTMIAPPQPPLDKNSVEPGPSGAATEPPGKPKKRASLLGARPPKKPPQQPSDQSSMLLAELCLPVLAGLRGKAAEAGDNEAGLAAALGQLEIAFVHAEVAKPGLCEMFFRELLTTASTSDSSAIRDIVATSVPKKFVKSKSTRR